MKNAEKIAECLRALAREIEGGASIPYHAKEIARGFVLCPEVKAKNRHCATCFHGEAHRPGPSCTGGCAPRDLGKCDCAPAFGTKRAEG